MARNQSFSPADLAHEPAGASPPPTQSKRDKRKQVISEKLNNTVQGFNQNLRSHFEAQMMAAQVDIALIMRADPYQNKPLDDGGDEIARCIAELVDGPQFQNVVVDSGFIAEAGKWYAQYANQVNDFLEDRDRSITMLANKHSSQLNEIESQYRFHVQLAHEEHKLLSETVRQRLYTTLDKRRRILLAEKEALDIGDSNAAALHPDQFRHINPSSPGGALNARKTRGARNKLGDVEDMPNAATVQDNRRKRKAAFEETDGSPGPASRGLDAAGSPYKDAKARLTHTQFDAPAYSLERLFTEKELSMHMNTAGVAATNFLLKLQTNGNGNATSHKPNGVNGHHAEPDDAPTGIPTIVTDAMDLDDDPTPAADMDRGANTASHFSAHQTRGVTRSALSDLATIAEGCVPISHAHHGIPHFVPAIMGAKANGAAPTPAPVAASEVEQDFALLARAANDYDDPVSNKILAQAADLKRPPQFVEYRFLAPSAAASDKDDLAAAGLLAGGGGVAMSRQTSRGGVSDAGGGEGAAVPMSRRGNGSSLGGVGMRRTASGLGREVLAGEVGSGSGSGRRGRGRGA